MSPSLEGVLSHESLSYEGIVRPLDIMRSFDRPLSGRAKGARRNPSDDKILERYFYDLYGVFMKKLSTFVADASAPDDVGLRLQALLQEMIKVKRMMRDS